MFLPNCDDLLLADHVARHPLQASPGGSASLGGSVHSSVNREAATDQPHAICTVDSTHFTNRSSFEPVEAAKSSAGLYQLYAHATTSGGGRSY